MIIFLFYVVVVYVLCVCVCMCACDNFFIPAYLNYFFVDSRIDERMFG